jgi:hypothetical protein
MDILRILPKGENIENIIELFRNTLIDSKCEHSSKVSVFLVTKEKFERSWRLIYPNNEDALLESLKEEYLELINQRRVTVTVTEEEEHYFLKNIKKNIDENDIF